MPLVYKFSPSGSLRQGEIVQDVYEHRVSSPPVAQALDVLGADTHHHPLAMVMNPWCDLHQDYAARQTKDAGDRNILHYVLLCDLYERGDIRDQFDNARLWKRADSNRDPRYHHIAGSPVAGRDELPDLYMDFKKVIALPLAGLYDALESGHVKRVALVPALFREQIMQRFYSFMARVSLPD